MAKLKEMHLKKKLRREPIKKKVVIGAGELKPQTLRHKAEKVFRAIGKADITNRDYNPYLGGAPSNPASSPFKVSPSAAKTELRRRTTGLKSRLPDIATETLQKIVPFGGFVEELKRKKFKPGFKKSYSG